MVFYKYKKLLKDNIKNWINKSTDNFDNFNQGKLSKKSIGELIRASHFSAPFSMIIMFMFCSKFVCNMLFGYIILISIAFLIFDGCFITFIEQKYCEDDFTIVDPCLELSNIEKTNKNRFLISIPMGVLFIISTLFIYYIRFSDKP